MEKYYQISDLEAITGIKAPTIRMWEMRYDIIRPKRNDSNRRYYDQATLNKFILIAQLYYSDVKISTIAQMSVEELKNKALELYKPSKEFENLHLDLHKAVLDYNVFAFFKILNDYYLAYNYENFISDIILPYLYKIDVLYKLSILNELHKNFAFDNVSRFLFNIMSAIDKYFIPDENKRILIYSDSEPFNKILLLACEVVLKRNNYYVIAFNSIGNQKFLLRNIDSFNVKRVLNILPLSQEDIKNLLNFVQKNNSVAFYVVDLLFRLDVSLDNLVIINYFDQLQNEI